jgi:hypothetical protein
LADDGTRDIVVAAPVGGVAGDAELVQVAGAERPGQRTRMRGGIHAWLDQFAPSAQRQHFALLGDRRRAWHDGNEGNAERACEPGFGNRGAARGRIDRRLALSQHAVAQRIKEQRAREPMLEAARGMHRLVFQQQADAGQAGQGVLVHGGVGRSGSLAAQPLDRGARPTPPLRVDRAARCVHPWRSQ